MATKLRENPLQASNTHTRSKTSYAVWSPGDGTAIAATESGTFFHVKQDGVQAFKTTSTSDFYDVHGFAYDDVWAVGTFGAIWRFDGSQWFPITDNPSSGIYDPTWYEAVWGTSSENIFVCGDNSEILHFNGTKWKYLLKWDRVGPKEFPDRWYSLAGTDDGTIYAVGSPYNDSDGEVKAGFVRIKSGGTPELLDAQTSTSFLNAIARIPGTDELLLCGGSGTLRRIKGDKISIEAEDVIEENDKFYAIEAVSKDNIVVVGWGVILTYDGTSWERKTIAGTPFLEGIAYSGQGVFTAVGWMGKILKFDLAKNQWYTLQNGRVSNTLAVAALEDGSVISSANGGNLIIGNAAGNFQQKFSLTLDLNVAIALDERSVLLAGENGYIAEVTVESDGELNYLSERGGNETWSVYCSSPSKKGVYLGCTDLVVREWSNGELKEVEGIADSILAIDSREGLEMQALFHVSETVFVVRVQQEGSGPLTTYLIDLHKEKAQKLEIASDDILAGDDGVLYIISDSLLYRATNLQKRDSWKEMAEISPMLISVDEQIYCASIRSEVIVLGGTRGTILHIDTKGHIKQSHSGSYSRIDCIASTTNGLTYAGHKWGRLKRVDFENKRVSGFSISAPTWWAAVATTSGSLLCGQDGALGFLKKNETHVTISAPLFSSDYLCCVAIHDAMKCLAGVEHIVLWKEASPALAHKIPNTVITAVNYIDSTVYFGTSGGEVLTIPLNDLESSKVADEAFSSILKTPLKSPIVDIAVLSKGIRITCEDGKIFFFDKELCLLHDLGAKVSRGAIPQNSEDAYCAGQLIREFQTAPERRMFVAQLSDKDSIREIAFPSSFGDRLLTKEVSLYGSDEKNGFWFGGQSGELVVLVDDAWYQVSTGIGNQLHSITTAHDRLVVCGRFGAVRFGDMNIFRKRIAALSDEKNKLETTIAQSETNVYRLEFNLSVVARRLLDGDEFLEILNEV